MTRIYYENLKLLNEPFEKVFKDKFEDFLANGWYVLGKEVAGLEEEFAAYHNEQFAVGVSNGLDALVLSLKCCDFEPGQEVIVPSNTYIATILAIMQCGLKPVLVEPDIRTYNIDPSAIEEAITPNTAAIIVVHLYGLPCDMEPIMQLAGKYGLRLIEDCAQAHGAKYNGKLVGTFGDFGAFSFYPTKNMGALGDAGAVLCRHETDYNKLRRLRNYGSERKYYNEMVGYNARLDELQAAFLRIKLQHLDQINNHKRMIADIYNRELSDEFILPHRENIYHHVYHIFNIRHSQRDKLKSFLFNAEIDTEIHYPVAPYRQNALKGLFDAQEKMPIADEIHQTTLSLPCSIIHSVEQIERTVAVLNSFVNG